MNQFLAQLMAALAALSAAIGTPVDAGKLPDRPAIVQSVPASSKGVISTSPNQPSDFTKSSDDVNKVLDNSSKSNQIEVAGTVASVQTNGSTTTITIGGQTITVDSSTKVEGKLEVGAQVQVEATKQASGDLVAFQIEVKTASATKPTEDKTSTQIKSGDTKNSKDSGSQISSNDSKSDTKSVSGTNDSSSNDKSGTSSINDSSSSDKSGTNDSKDSTSSDKSGSGTSTDSKSGSDSSSDDGSSHN
jgi:hypothetical protein